MAFFQQDSATTTTRKRKIYALYELAYTTVDVAAALLFLAGSVLFFYKSLENPAIWCFVIGSACFALKPVLRIVRELHLLRTGDYEDLAERAWE